MRVKLFLDEDVHLVLGLALRKRGQDVVHAGEISRRGLNDLNQLIRAASEGRCLVTFNVGDFVQLHNEWLGAGKTHAGIIVSKQLPVGETLRRLLVFLQNKDAETMRSELRFL
jgi:hypothetical protein